MTFSKLLMHVECSKLGRSYRRQISARCAAERGPNISSRIGYGLGVCIAPIYASMIRSRLRSSGQALSTSPAASSKRKAQKQTHSHQLELCKPYQCTSGRQVVVMATSEPKELNESKYEPGTYFLGSETWQVRRPSLLVNTSTVSLPRLRKDRDAVVQPSRRPQRFSRSGWAVKSPANCSSQHMCADVC